MMRPTLRGWRSAAAGHISATPTVRFAILLAAVVFSAFASSAIWPAATFAQESVPGAPKGGITRSIRVRGGVGGPTAARGEESMLSNDGVFLPPDRQAKRRLELAQEMLTERRFGESVRLLGSLLEHAEDFFFKPNPEQPVYRSLKAEAGRLIGELPDEGRESYELQFGSRARQMLKEGAAAGDLGQISEVSRRFFHTQAGAEATFLLGRHYLDQNRPQAAALCFDRLRSVPDAAKRLEPVLSLSLATCWLRSGQPDKAQAVLAALKKSSPSSEILVAGKPVPLFRDEPQAIAWMEKQFGKQPVAVPVEAEQWAMYRGNETRNAPSHGGQPLLSVRWRQRTSDDRAIEKYVDKLRHDYLSQEVVALSSMHPLAVSDVVVMRTAFALQAVDFETGKLVWKYSTGDESLEQFLRAMGSQQSAQATQQLLAGLDQRMWEDATYGTLSSDGDKVYFIEDLGLSGLTSNVVMTVLPSGQRRYSVNTRGTNRLAARELRTQGKLKWEIGGVTGEDEPKLAGAFFLGPPLPLLGNLYVLAEIKGQEIRLVALSPETGAMQWSQQLAVVDPPVTSDAFRRNSGATPSFADGVLVCPTTSGAVVGLDLSTRSLLWGYQYPRIQQQPVERFNARANVYAGTDHQANEHWADASLTVADGRVLVTPVESDQLYCLNLVDGKELWKQSRGKNLYVGCVHRGKVLLVGRNSVSMLNLSDGTKAWGELKLPGGAMPSGRGFYSGEHYYLPLSTAEVVKLNLQSGQIDGRARSRSGNIPGNLVCYRDTILSQGADYLDAYYQLDALKERIAKTLATNGDDAKALASLGEIKLDEGQLAEAISLLRRSYAVAPETTTRDRLIDCLLDGLRSDFAGYRQHLDELDKLIDQPQQKLAFLRLKAAGLQKADEVLPAFETYMQLADQDATWTLDEIDERLTVRRDRWIREQLALLRKSADAAGQAQIDAAVELRFNKAMAAQSAEALRVFVNVFGSQPAAVRASDALLERLGDDELLEQSLLMQPRALSADNALAGPAVARLALGLRRAGQSSQAGVYYRLLNQRFAEVACHAGKTGKQLVDDLPADDPIRKLLPTTASWPEGNVAVREDKNSVRTGLPNQVTRPIDLDVASRTGPLFQGVGIAVSVDAQQLLIGEDGWGEQRFRIPLTEQGSRRNAAINRNAYNAPSINYANASDGLLVLSLGTQLMAIDTMRGGDLATNRVLWNHDRSDQIGGLGTTNVIVPRPVALAWGGTRFVPEDTFGRRFGLVGPVGPNGVYFQRLHDLFCVDPLTGKTIWSRKNVGLGNDLFGDDEYIFAAPPGAADTHVYKASTGEMLGTRRVAPVERRMATFGRQVLSWESASGKVSLEMRDVWADKVAWSHSFAAGSKAAMVAQEVVGVYEPNGGFTLVRLPDGKLLGKESLRQESALMGIHLLPWTGGYLLVTNTAARGQANVSVQPVPNVNNGPLVSGHIYCFDRESGKQLWPSPVAIDQMGLLLTQPREMPVLVLARQIYKPGPASSREPKMSIMCIDKRSGRLVYHKEDVPGTAIGNYVIAANQAKHAVTVTLPTRVITLTYTHDAIDSQAKRIPDLAEQELVLLDVLGLPRPAPPESTPPAGPAIPGPTKPGPSSETTEPKPAEPR